MISYGQITVSGIEDGYNRAVIQLYMRSSAALVDAPTSHPVYTYSTGALSFVPTGWSLSVPATDGNPCWVTSATVVSREATCAVDSWATPVKLVEDGRGGDDATAYHLIVSSPVVVKTKAGSYNVSTITLSAKSQSGSNPMSDYSGRFKVETTTNGTSWTQRYPSSGSGSNQTSYTYTIPASITAIRCSLYLAGGLTTLLDQQIVPIVTDGTDITITSKSVTYQKGTSGTTAPTGTWQTAIPSVGQGEYLWTKTVVTYSDGTSTEAYSVARQGANGGDGTSVTITSTEVRYQTSTSGTTTPTGTWQTSVPSVSNGQYLWTRTVVTYSDGKSTTSYSVSRYGTDGNDAYTVILTNESHQFIGDTEKALVGNTTIGVIAYKGTTQVATSVTNNNISGKPTGMTTSVSNNNSTSTSITVSVTTSMTTTHGTLTIPVVVDGKTFSKVFSYSLQLAPRNGDPASSVYMRTSTAAVSRSESGDYNPTAITMEAMVQTGTSDPLAITGFFKVETTADGTTWNPIYSSSTAESFHSYTIATAGITAIRISLYKESGMSTLYDQRIIPIVNEGYTLTAEQAINRATAIYGVCSTSATSAAKEVSITNFEAYNGAQITVLFTHEHQAGNPTLKVIGKTTLAAKPIYATSKDGTLTRLAANNPPTSVEERGWIENSLVNFVYDETNSRWIIVDSSALQKIDNILTKVIAGTHGAINMDAGTFTFNGENGSISYDDGDLNITGKINALEGGTIGGFTIGSSSIFKDMSSIIDTTHDGVYLGTDGIALGKGAFKVTSAGKLYSTSAEIGSFTIDVNSIRNLAKSSTSSKAISLSTAEFTRTINGVSRNTLNFAIGSKFGVANDGTLYAGGVAIDGTVNATNISLLETGNITAGGSNVGTYTNKVEAITVGGDVKHIYSTSGGAVYYNTKALQISSQAVITRNQDTTVMNCYMTFDPDDFKIVSEGGLTIRADKWGLLSAESITSTYPYDVVLTSNRGIYLTSAENGVYINGNTKNIDYLYSAKNIYAGVDSTSGAIDVTFKTSVNDGIAGSVLGSNGNVYLTSDTNPFVRFYVNNATTWTQTLTANANGLEASSSFYATTLYENNVSLVNKYAPIPVVKYSESGSQTISDYSMATGTSWTTIGSFTLDKGLNHVIVSCEFASNATGRRGLCIATSNTGNAMSNNARRYVAPANGANTSVVIDMYISPTANDTTYYLRGYQNSGSALNVTTRLTAVNYG